MGRPLSELHHSSSKGFKLDPSNIHQFGFLTNARDEDIDNLKTNTYYQFLVKPMFFFYFSNIISLQFFIVKFSNSYGLRSIMFSIYYGIIHLDFREMSRKLRNLLFFLLEVWF